MTKSSSGDNQQFEKLLMELRTKLTDEVEHIKGDTLSNSKDSVGDLSSYSLHMADQASDNYDREFLLSLADNEQEILIKIDDALKRIKDGEYGICGSCEKKIPKARLKAMPFAEHCVSCQEEIEKGQRD